MNRRPHRYYEPEAELLINMGPQHPSTHGVLNFLLYTDGEVVRRAVPEVGYLHRGIEKICEKVGYLGITPYTDRVDYLSAMTANQGYAMAVEKLMGMEVPKRAEYLRVIASELNRIASHLIMVGCMVMDIGAYTPFLHGVRERETINDLMEMLCGNRLTYNYAWIGGVSFDLPEGFSDRCLQFIDHFMPFLDEYNDLISNNKIYIERCADIGIISAEQAIGYGLVGPNLRASGVDFDLRRDEPYSIYPELDFEVIVGKGIMGTIGDCYDRYWMRIEEMRQSALMVRQCIKQIPLGEIRANVPRIVKPAAGEAYSRVESARGDFGVYVVSDGTKDPYRVRFRTGSFNAMSIFEEVSPSMMIADLVALISSLDVIAPEIDR